MPAIQTQNLTKTFVSGFFEPKHSCRALNGVSLSIPKGSLFTLLGPNGAGKTTFLNILAGLIPPTEGSYSLQGRIGYFMSGTQGFLGSMSGWDNLKYFCAIQNIVGDNAQKTAGRLIADFGMEAYIQKPVQTYSAGMRHRLLLARTLIGEPDILLLDEPVTSLDPVAARSFHSLLRDFLNCGLGKTILLSTHQLEEAREISDTLGFLYQGRLLWQKNAEDFRSGGLNLLDEYLRTAREINA